MKYTKTTIRELSARYRSILKKCFLLNALALGLFAATSANAAGTAITDLGSFTDGSGYLDPTTGSFLQASDISDMATQTWVGENYTTTTDMNTALGLKANTADVYTKAAADELLGAKANSADVYTKAQADELLGAKANSADVYTKTAADELLGAKADTTTVNAALALKANSADVYTKGETDSAISSAIEGAKEWVVGKNYVTMADVKASLDIDEPVGTNFAYKDPQGNPVTLNADGTTATGAGLDDYVGTSAADGETVTTTQTIAHGVAQAKSNYSFASTAFALDAGAFQFDTDGNVVVDTENTSTVYSDTEPGHLSGTYTLSNKAFTSDPTTVTISSENAKPNIDATTYDVSITGTRYHLSADGTKLLDETGNNVTLSFPDEYETLKATYDTDVARVNAAKTAVDTAYGTNGDNYTAAGTAYTTDGETILALTNNYATLSNGDETGARNKFDKQKDLYDNSLGTVIDDKADAAVARGLAEGGAIRVAAEAVFADKQDWISRELGYDTNETDAKTVLAGFTDQTGEGNVGITDAVLQLNSTIGDTTKLQEGSVIADIRAVDSRVGNLDDMRTALNVTSEQVSSMTDAVVYVNDKLGTTAAGHYVAAYTPATDAEHPATGTVGQNFKALDDQVYANETAIATLNKGVGDAGSVLYSVNQTAQDGLLNKTSYAAGTIGAAITANTTAISVLNGDEGAAGSVKTIAKGYADTAEANAKDYTDALANGAVKNNTDAIAVLNGDEGAEGSVKTIAKGYADTAEDNANTYTDNQIALLESATESAFETVDETVGDLSSLENLKFFKGKEQVDNGAGAQALGDAASISDLLTNLNDNLGAEFARVDSRINKLETKMEKGLAANNALAGLVPLDHVHKTQISAALGGYKSNQALAVGAFHYLNDRTLLNAGAAYGGNSSVSYKVGVTFGF